MFRKRVPAWVRSFPIAMDKATLTLLAKNSKGPFEHPREMNFCLIDFSEGPGLDEARVHMKAKGWRSEAVELPEKPGKIILTATKDDYVMTEDTYKRDVIFFNHLAEMYDAKYDGWFASN